MDTDSEGRPQGNKRIQAIVAKRLVPEMVLYAYTLKRDGAIHPVRRKPTTEKEEDDALE